MSTTMDVLRGFSRTENIGSFMMMERLLEIFLRTKLEIEHRSSSLGFLIFLVLFVELSLSLLSLCLFAQCVDADLESSDDEDEDEDPPSLRDPHSPGSETYYRAALTEFLISQMAHYEHFLNGTWTSHTESFHGLCNFYYTKGLTLSFPQYVMRKEFAALHWNELRDKKKTDEVSNEWKFKLMDRFISHLRAISVKK